MKICNKCGKSLPVEQFFKLGGNRVGVRGTCKACYAVDRKNYRAKNSEAIKQYRAQYLAKNRDHYLAACKEYRDKNREACNARSIASQRKKPEYYSQKAKYFYHKNRRRLRELAREWWRANPEKAKAYKAARRAAMQNAFPKWADIGAIDAIYKKAATMDDVHVDHIVPLVSPLVCGLHIAANLQILPASENMSKGNRFWPGMP